MVTHDVDEALALADRVLVLRGGQVAYEAAVACERPRHRDDHDLVSLRNQLLAELGVDQKGTTMKTNQLPDSAAAGGE